MLDLFSAFGLAGSAGLNAYIPLLLVALTARFPLNDPLLNLAEPYNIIGSWWAIGIIAVLLVIEMLVDKIPAVDTVNDVIQTFVRPAAGAVLFAANADIVTNVHPVLALGAGLVVAGGVHAVKGVARPVVTATTAGTGNWLASLLEDIMAFFTSLLAILWPVFGAILLVAVLFFGWRLYRRRKRRTAFR